MHTFLWVRLLSLLCKPENSQKATLHLANESISDGYAKDKTVSTEIIDNKFLVTKLKSFFIFLFSLDYYVHSLWLKQKSFKCLGKCGIEINQ